MKLLTLSSVDYPTADISKTFANIVTALLSKGLSEGIGLKIIFKIKVQRQNTKIVTEYF